MLSVRLQDQVLLVTTGWRLINMGVFLWLSSLAFVGGMIGFISGYMFGWAGLIPGVILSSISSFVITYYFQKGEYI